MVIRELVTKFGFDVDETKLENMEKGVEQLKVGLVGLVALTAAATAALFGMTKVSANAADNITNTAKAVGVTTTALQELGYAALLSGSNFDEMATGLRFLSKNIGAAAKDPASDLAKTFKSLGVQVKNANGSLRTADEVLYDVSDAIARIDDPARKVGISMELFGKSGSKLIQTLERGSKGIKSFSEELRASGGFLDEEALERLGAFNDSWDRFFAVTSGLRNVIASELAPLLGGMIDDFREWFKVNGMLIKQKLVETLRAFAWWLKLIFTFGMRVGDMFLTIVKYIPGLEYAIRGLLLVLTALTGIAIISGLKLLGGVILSVAASIWAAIAPLALVAAKFIAIGALIFLVAEDIYTYFTGGDSVTGVIVDAFVSMWGWIKKTFFAGMDWLYKTLDGFADWFATWFTNFTKPFVNFMKWLGDGLTEFFGPAMNIRTNVKQTGSITGISPTTAPVGSARAGAGGSNVRVDAPISVVVPPGTDPAQVPSAIESGIRLGIEDIFGQTQRATAPFVVQ